MQISTKLWNRNFILMMQGALVSRLGDALYSIAIGIWVYQTTGSEALMGIFTSIALFSTMIFSPLFGALVDRVSRKSILVGMDALRGVVMLSVGLLLMADKLTIPTLFLFTIVSSLAGVLFNPASSTVLLDIVPKERFPQAQSINSVLSNGVQIIGKGLSGVLLVAVGVGPLIVFNGISFLFSAFTEMFIKVPRTPKHGDSVSPKALVKAMGQGFKAIVQTPGLNFAVLGASFGNLMSSGVVYLFLILLTQKGYSLEEYGIFLSMLSISALIPSVVVSLVHFTPRQRFYGMMACFILSTPFFVAPMFVEPFVLFVALFFIASMLNTVSNIFFGSAMMMLLPESQRAVVLGFLTAGFTGASAISTLIYGFLASTIPIAIIGAIGMGLSSAPVLFLAFNKPFRASFSMETAPSESPPPPQH